MSEEKMIKENVKLPFAKNEVYRLMRKNLDSDKMIKEPSLHIFGGDRLRPFS